MSSFNDWKLLNRLSAVRKQLLCDWVNYLEVTSQVDQSNFSSLVGEGLLFIRVLEKLENTSFKSTTTSGTFNLNLALAYIQKRVPFQTPTLCEVLGNPEKAWVLLDIIFKSLVLQKLNAKAILDWVDSLEVPETKNYKNVILHIFKLTHKAEHLSWNQTVQILRKLGLPAFAFTYLDEEFSLLLISCLHSKRVFKSKSSEKLQQMENYNRIQESKLMFLADSRRKAEVSSKKILNQSFLYLLSPRKVIINQVPFTVSIVPNHKNYTYQHQNYFLELRNYDFSLFKQWETAKLSGVSQRSNSILIDFADSETLEIQCSDKCKTIKLLDSLKSIKKYNTLIS